MLKIGVTYEVKITHKSIGKTNDEWEKNRLQFVEKYKDSLPLRIKYPDIQSYIFVHDQHIILRFEKSEKFKNFGDFTYVFLGNGEINKLTHITNIIIVRDLEHNLEDYPKLTAFTGWYALWKNKLLDENKSILLLEYDVHLNDNFIYHLNKFADDKSPMIGFVPFSMSNYHFVMNPEWVTTVNNAIKLTYKGGYSRKHKKTSYPNETNW